MRKKTYKVSATMALYIHIHTFCLNAPVNFIAIVTVKISSVSGNTRVYMCVCLFNYVSI